MALSASSGTPKGTPPQPTRRSTKHKTVAFGKLLMEKHKLRKAMKTLKKLQAAPVVAVITEIKKGKK